MGQGFSRPGDRRFDGLEYLLVSSTAAQVSRQRLFDLLARWLRVLVEQCFGGDEKPWRAVAALRRAKVGECVLQRVEPSVADQPFDRRHVAAAAVDAENETRQYRLTVEQHGARAALAELAAMLGAAQIQVFTQDLEQRFVRRERDLGRFAVHGQGDGAVLHWGSRG